MPERHLQDANGYRYAYQGQEKDPETGKEAFQLRLWDSRIGRWLTTDPYGQYSSPYLGMGNNPINLIDPDGGATIPQHTLQGINDLVGDLTFFANGVGGFDNFWEKVNFHGLDEVTVKPSGFFLSFDGERVTGMNRVDGNLNLIRTWPNQKNYAVDSWYARSGSRTLLPIPNATNWQLSNFSYRDNRGTRYNNRMIRDGIGFSINITPDPRWGRSLLRIHPDGGATGTQGCIGLVCGADRLTAFENAVQPLLRIHGTLRLEVSGSYNGPDGGWNNNTQTPANVQRELNQPRRIRN